MSDVSFARVFSAVGMVKRIQDVSVSDVMRASDFQQVICWIGDPSDSIKGLFILFHQLKLLKDLELYQGRCFGCIDVSMQG